MRHVLGVIYLLATGFAQAATVTIDFDDLSVGYGDAPGGQPDAAFVTQGYFFYVENGGVVADGAGLELSATNFTSFDNGFVDIERADGGAFALYSVDAHFDTVYVETSSGDNFSVTDLTDIGTGFWLSLNSVQFHAGFSEFATVDVDDLVLGAVVPVPAAVWLFGSGLGLLGWFRRRKTA
jgi:hypothetical protein